MKDGVDEQVIRNVGGIIFLGEYCRDVNRRVTGLDKVTVRPGSVETVSETQAAASSPLIISP